MKIKITAERCIQLFALVSLVLFAAGLLLNLQNDSVTKEERAQEALLEQKLAEQHIALLASHSFDIALRHVNTILKAAQEQEHAELTRLRTTALPELEEELQKATTLSQDLENERKKFREALDHE